MHGVVFVHRPLVLQRKDQIEIFSSHRQERVADLRCCHGKTPIELGDVAFAQKFVGRGQAFDSKQPQLLRQTALPGTKTASPRPRACGE